jgi:WD40 repeat protein/class 3 adenylate cyclase
MDVEDTALETEGKPAERIQAFLISDIRGYSTFTAQRGAAAAAHLATTFTDLSRDAITARGGRVLGLRGDEVLAAFESPCQAVRAALDIQFACIEVTAVEPEFPLGIGAGVDFGEAVVVDDGYHGVAINMAARLCSQATAGQVLVTATVVDAASNEPDLAFETGATVELKGFADPVQMFHARSRRGAGWSPAIGRESHVPESLAPLPLDLDEATPLVGREVELSWLRGMWRQAHRGHGRVIVVSGPTGIGKRRLVAEMARLVRRGGDRVHYAGGGGAVRGQSLAEIASARNCTSPGMWVLDDLDLLPDSIAALAEAVEAVEGRPALVVGLIREVGGDRKLSTLVDRLDRHGDGVLQLGPLDLAGVRGIGEWYAADVGDLPAESILRSSGGIPGAIHELVAQWADNEARRRLEAAAAWMAEGRSRQAAGRSFADNVIAAHLGRIYDAGRVEELSGACPYKGLEPFEEADAAYFFGREQLVGELAARMVGSGLLGVVGPSGSGKSSVVLAGLIPSLRAGLLPGSERWLYAIVRPGEHPNEALDDALAGHQPDRRDGHHLVLVVDQFEEVFTATGDAGARDGFIERLVRLARQPDVVVVITVRADFTGHCAPYPELADLLAANLVLVGPMTADQLRRVIEAPARRVGIRVESALLDALVTEVANEPGGLPLLSTALVQLWKDRDGEWLRLDTYERSGGVRTAVARLAESSYDQLSESEQDGARTILLRLVDAGEGDAAVRRRVPMSEFDLDDDPTAAAVLLVLTRDRLLTRDEEQVEIAHEALIREWPRLRNWLQEDIAGRQLRSQITQSARQWAERGQDPADLYHGARLSAALDWWRSHHLTLNALERDFLTESRAADQRQLEEQRRTNRRLRTLLAGTAIFLVVAVVAGLFAFVQRNHARSAQRTAQAQALESDAERVGTLAQTERNLDLSLLLAVAGVKLENLPQTRGDLLAALQQSPAALRFIRPSTTDITGIAISPNGQLMASGDAAGAVRFEDLRTWKPAGTTIQLPAPVPPLGLRFSPDGRSVAVATGKGDLSQVYVINVATRQARLIGSWPGRVDTIPNGSTTLAYSPDGTELAVGSANWPPSAASPVSEHLALVDASTGTVRWQHDYPVLSGQEELQVAFTPGGTLVTSAENGTTDLWNTRTGQVTRQFPIGGLFALSPDGRQAAIGLNTFLPDETGVTSLVILDLSTGKEQHLHAVPDSTWMATLQYTPDSKSLVGGSLDGDVRVWDVSTGSIVQTFVSQSAGRTQVAVDPTGQTVLSGNDNGSIIAWDLAGSQALGRGFAWSTPGNGCPSWPCMAVNPAGTIMATDENDGTVDLVDLRTLKWYATLPATKGQIANGLTFTPGGELVTGDAAGDITFWDTQTRAVLRKLHVADPVNSLAVSPDGKLLALQMQAATSSNTVVDVIGLTTGKTVHSYPVPNGSGSVAFSPDGRDLAALGCCTPASMVELWDAASGQRLPGPHITGQLQSIAFSPASPVLGIGTADGKLYLWDASRRAQLGGPVTVAASNVLDVSFSPDGKLLAGSLRDGSTILIDLESRQQLGNSFPIEESILTVPLFTPAGGLLISYDGTATDWPTNLGAWESYACQVAGRDITPEEWANVLPHRPYEHVCPP